ncbi:MAG TPA: hypothetical protein PK530_12765, partial [Anaerolineales bacterium]|nr:hypothetical protein [Anaerolineales bacterium]
TPPAEPPADAPPTPPAVPVPPRVLPPAPVHNGHANGKNNDHPNGHANGATNGYAKGNGRPAPRTGKPIFRTQTAPTPAIEPPASSSKPTPRRAAAPALPPESSTQTDNGGTFVVGFGRFRGRQVHTLTPNSLLWLANTDGQGLIPSSPESEHAQAAARKFLAANPVPA